MGTSRYLAKLAIAQSDFSEISEKLSDENYPFVPSICIDKQNYDLSRKTGKIISTTTLDKR
jgi:hypothetical protein